MHNIITLKTPTALVRVAPQLGGSVISYTVREAESQPWQEVFRPVTYDEKNAHSEHNIQSGRGAGMFPLLPFSNRIFNARLQFQDKTYALRNNHQNSQKAEPHAIHGVGCHVPWQVAHVNVEADCCTKVTLKMSHTANEDWPWNFEATQTYELKKNELHCSLSLTNASAAPFPAGLGWHPYFAYTPQTTLQASIDTDVITKSQWNFNTPQNIAYIAASSPVDAGFSGLNGEIDLCYHSDLDSGLAINGIKILASENLRHLIVYTPKNELPNQSCCGIEPVSHAIDGFNRAERGETGTGRLTLAPMETIQARLSISPY